MEGRLKEGSSYKIAVIGDQLLVRGFKLAGVKEAHIAETTDDVEQSLKNIFEKENIGIIIISENAIEKIKDRRLLYKIDNSLVPLVIEVPGYGQEEKHADTLRNLVMRVIGIDILAKKSKG